MPPAARNEARSVTGRTPRALGHDAIAALVTQTPEQRVFDWKRDFTAPITDTARGEVVKDILAVANGTALARAPGMVVYGVDPRRPEPIVGISGSWDDAKLQQLVRGAVHHPIEFLYYEATENGRTVGVIDVPRSQRPFHVVTRDLGALREGQILIRDGSTTRGIRQDDLRTLYLQPGYGFAEQLLRQAGVQAQLTQAEVNQAYALLAVKRDLIREVEAIAGLPPGSISY